MNNKHFESYEDKYADYLYEEACNNVRAILDSCRKTEVSYNDFYKSIKEITWRAYALNDNKNIVFKHQFDDKVYKSLLSCIDDALCGATTTFISDFKFYKDFEFTYYTMTPVAEVKFGESKVTFYVIPVID